MFFYNFFCYFLGQVSRKICHWLVAGSPSCWWFGKPDVEHSGSHGSPVPLGNRSHFDVSRSRGFPFFFLPWNFTPQGLFHQQPAQAMIPVAPEAVDLPKPFGLGLAASESTEAESDNEENTSQSQFRDPEDGSKAMN